MCYSIRPFRPNPTGLRFQWGDAWVNIQRGFVGATTLTGTTLYTTTMSRAHTSALNAY